MDKWIDVKKRFPPDDNWRMYAVLTDERDLHKVQVAWFQHSDKTFRFERKPTRIINVTHWLMLPQWHDVEINEDSEQLDSICVPDDAFDLVMGNPSKKLKYAENVFDGEKWIPKKDNFA